MKHVQTSPRSSTTRFVRQLVFCIIICAIVCCIFVTVLQSKKKNINVEGLHSKSKKFLLDQDKSSSQHATYPLVLGDPSLEPIHVLEDNFILQSDLCDTYRGDDKFNCRIEWDEWMLVKAFVQPGDVVMELGARFATTSCIIARQVGPTGIAIAVEPDDSVHGFLLHNRWTHQCGFHAILGTLGAKTQYLRKNIIYTGYATLTASSDPRKGEVALPNVDIEQVERLIGGRQINVALIDCEGCIGSVSEAGLLDQVDLILLEEDILPSYDDWHATFFQKGFECIWYTKDTYDPTVLWSQGLRHSAWVRRGSGRTFSSCEDYVADHDIDPKLLNCDVCPTPPER